MTDHPPATCTCGTLLTDPCPAHSEWYAARERELADMAARRSDWLTRLNAVPRDHPPAIPAIQVRVTYRACPDCFVLGGHLADCARYAEFFADHPPATPLGLSPEQPARCGGTET